MAAAKKCARRAKGAPVVTVSVPPAIRRLIESAPAAKVGLVEALSAPAADADQRPIYNTEAGFGTWRGTDGDAEGRAIAAAVDERPLILRLGAGLHRGVSGDVYYARTPGIASKSILDVVRKAPAKYEAWLKAETKDDATPAKRFGSALHCALFEPERFAVAYEVKPKIDRRSNAGKEADAAWQAERPGVEALTEDDAKLIGAMVASVMRHEMAAALLVDVEREVTVRWRDPETGVECKARLDGWAPSIDTILDLKSTDDASPAGFERSLTSYGYHRQAAMYLDGTRAAGGNAESFVFICVEKDPPHLVGLYEADFDAMAKGRSSIREDLETFRRCTEAGVFPGYSPEICKASLARWASW